MARAKRTGSLGRRRDIIQAALACFTEYGFEPTTMAVIRERSGASTGSIYHHYQSKEQLGAAVYLEGIRDWQAGLLAELEPHTDARAGIAAIVRYHVSWVRENPEWARYLFQMRRLEFMASADQDIRELNQRFFHRVGAWFKRHIDSGAVRKMPRELFVAILLGPCQDLARQLVSGPSRLDPDRAAATLGEAAWNSLRTEA